ncbi:hypothetical protein FQA47_023222 [Oryzias melastigma]|uniref:Uncharacterized protein n=1 Tax=Oryzias melastigma TaxID=30732 RepID=A0A834FEJ9_ORYME|nr:hypothetical protein FQA47_023222 [Oryzias melastigma]
MEPAPPRENCSVRPCAHEHRPAADGLIAIEETGASPPEVHGGAAGGGGEEGGGGGSLCSAHHITSDEKRRPKHRLLERRHGHAPSLISVAGVTCQVLHAPPRREPRARLSSKEMLSHLSDLRSVVGSFVPQRPRCH